MCCSLAATCPIVSDKRTVVHAQGRVFKGFEITLSSRNACRLSPLTVPSLRRSSWLGARYDLRQEPNFELQFGSRQEPVIRQNRLRAPGTKFHQMPGSKRLSSNLESVPSIWKDLLSHQDLELQRASSVADAHVLRRKGHLKEQDKFIQFIIDLHLTHSPLEAMEKMERWIRDHTLKPQGSELSRLVPSIGTFHTQLKLVEALQEYDMFSHISQRRFVPPNFAEIRHILNISQVRAIASDLQLITFDADGTLYEDGHHFEQNNKMISLIISLLRNNVKVAIVTAAGYPGEPEKFEARIEGLLQRFKEENIPPKLCQRFFIMGGECNYLCRIREDYRLEFVPDSEWRLDCMLEWKEEQVEQVLDDAQKILEENAARMCMPVQIVRKERAVGVVPLAPVIYEVLEELTLTVQATLEAPSHIPFCAFNGGNDVFVDIGNKSLGLEALMEYLGACGKGTLHVGDRFTNSGNDSAARDKCSILWVANPDETAFFVRMMLQDVQQHKMQPYIE